jgi:hypothetical protein
MRGRIELVYVTGDVVERLGEASVEPLVREGVSILTEVGDAS